MGEVRPPKAISGFEAVVGEERKMVSNHEWRDEEIEVFMRRKAALAKGMDEMEAEKLAEQMLYRDRPVSGDDRRICLECTRFVKSRCQRGILAVRTLLQRCDAFKLRGGGQ